MLQGTFPGNAVRTAKGYTNATTVLDLTPCLTIFEDISVWSAERRNSSNVNSVRLSFIISKNLSHITWPRSTVASQYLYCKIRMLYKSTILDCMLGVAQCTIMILNVWVSGVVRTYCSIYIFFWYYLLYFLPLGYTTYVCAMITLNITLQNIVKLRQIHSYRPILQNEWRFKNYTVVVNFHSVAFSLWFDGEKNYR